jgi:hypothetical protein
MKKELYNFSRMSGKNPMNHRPLSLSDFKNWMTEQNGMSEFFKIGKDFEEDPNQKYIGNKVRPKVGESKLLERIETDDDADSVIQEFLENGGKVMAIEGKKVQIEVEAV